MLGFPVFHHLPEFAQTHVPMSRWCHPIISSSAILFSSCLQTFPASGSFPMRQFFISGGQSIRASALASVLPMNIQGWFLLGLTGLISLQSKGLSRDFSNTTVQSINSSVLSLPWASLVTQMVTCNAGSGRFPGEGNGNPLQYSCLENSMDRGSLAGYRPWDHKESETTEWLTHPQPSLWSNSHIHKWLLEKNIALTVLTFVSKVTSLLFNMSSRFIF